jgi:uncharacterized protein YbjQ (UPF0145 family)
MLVTTAFEVHGYRVVRHVGLVRGLSVRSRSLVGNIRATYQIIWGGSIKAYMKLAEDARQEAFELLMAQAQEMGANAVIGMRYDANEMGSVVTEVLAYGTAVVVEPLPGAETHAAPAPATLST